jgi:hypothetical protein
MKARRLRRAFFAYRVDTSARCFLANEQAQA